MNILIIDNGEYTWLAEHLATMTDVAYYSPWENAFPLTRMVLPGAGLKGIERVNRPIEYMRHEHPDLVVVPDLNQNDLELLAREWEFPVFGAGDGNQLEQDRRLLKEFLDDYNLPTGDYEIIVGIDELEKYLRDSKNEDKYIKVSTFRGDMNTFHHLNWPATSDWFARQRAQFGPVGNLISFLVEDPIETELEVSIEGIFVGSQLLRPFMVGIEIKDAGEAGYFCPSLSQLPPQVQKIISTLGDYFEERDYRNFFAVEIRLDKDGTPHVIDLACRMPVPPGAAMAHSAQNLLKLLTDGSQGFASAIDVGEAKFFTEIEVKSRWVVENFLHVRYPQELSDSIALFNHCIIEYERWCLPHMPVDPEMTAFGSVFATGGSLEDAAAECQETVKEIEALDITYKSDVLEEAGEKLNKLKAMGFKS